MSGIKVKKNIYKIKFFKAEYEEAVEIHDSAKLEFFSRVKKIHYDLNVYDKDFDAEYQLQESKEQSRSDDESSSDKSQNSQSHSEEIAAEVDKDEPPVIHPQWAKKLYRKITMKTHPDRLIKLDDEYEKNRLVRMYEEAVAAYSSCDYSKILIVAIDLDVDVPETEDVFKMLDEQASKYSKNTISVKETLFWLWWHVSEEEKEKLVLNFIKQKGWTSHRSGVKKSRKDGRPGKSISWLRKKI